MGYYKDVTGEREKTMPVKLRPQRKGKAVEVSIAGAHLEAAQFKPGEEVTIISNPGRIEIRRYVP